MGFLSNVRNVLFGKRNNSLAGGGGGSSFGDEAGVYWIHAQCQRCGEPLKSRVNLNNDPSLADDNQTWIVRKGLTGSGKEHCFQTIEVTLHFDSKKSQVLNAEATGGKLITAEEYEALKELTSHA